MSEGRIQVMFSDQKVNRKTVIRVEFNAERTKLIFGVTAPDKIGFRREPDPVSVPIQTVTNCSTLATCALYFSAYWKTGDYLSASAGILQYYRIQPGEMIFATAK